MRAFDNSEQEDISLPLALLDLDNVIPRQESYDTRWASVVLLQLTLALQATLVIVLWFRRSAHEALSIIDDFVMVSSTGCLAAALTSICILGLNTRWHVCQSPWPKKNKNFMEPALDDLAYQMSLGPTFPELRLAIFLAIANRLAIFYLAGSHTIPCRPTNIEEIYVSMLIWSVRLYMGYYFLLFMLAVILFPVRRDLSEGRLSDYLRGTYLGINFQGTLYQRLLKADSGSYISINFVLVTILIWNSENANAWEPWMWRDPWFSWFKIRP